MTKYWADVIPYPPPSGGGGGSGGWVNTTYPIWYLPFVTFTTLDHATLSGPVEAGSGTIIEVIGSLTGTDPGAAITASGTGTVEFLGDVLVSAVQVNGGTLVTTGTLTLDATSTLAAPGGTLSLIGAEQADQALTGALVNLGTIDFSTAGTQRLRLTDFSNQGTVIVGAGDTLDIAAPDFSNTGTITLDAGSTLDLALPGPLFDLSVRLGNIIENGGTLAVHLVGTIDNTGMDLQISTAESLGVTGFGRPGALASSGTTDPNATGMTAVLTGGTLVTTDQLALGMAPPTFGFDHATLDGVTVEGALALGTGADLHIAGGTRFVGLGGTGGAALAMLGNNGTLTFDGDTTLSWTGLLVAPGDLATATGGTTQETINANGALTIAHDSALTILGYGEGVSTTLNLASTFTNVGTIAVINGTIAPGSGGKLLDIRGVAGSSMVNDGFVTLETGESLLIETAYSGTGTIALAGNDTLYFNNSITTANIVLAGTGNRIMLTPPATGLTLDGLAAGDTLITQFATPLTSARYASGHLYLYSNGDQITDIATDSDLTAATLVITPNLYGGTLSIVATGALDTATLPTQTAAERLIIGTADLTNTGTLHIADVGVVEFQGAVSDAGTIAFDGATGSLVLDHPQGFHASIGAMQVGDSITLAPGSGYGLAWQANALEVLQNGTLAASFTLDSGYNLTDFTFDSSGLAPAITLTTAPAPAPAGQSFAVSDLTCGACFTGHGEAYCGPVAGLQGQFINITADNVQIATATPDVFIRTGSGDDAIQVTSGNNVIDASTGSNLLVGGSGHDTFFVDARDSAPTWDSFVNFHQGDAVTIWGYTAGVSTTSWAADLGSAGYQGLTLQIAADGSTVQAHATFAGLTAADLPNLAIQSGSVGGAGYLSIVHT